ncbi:VWA domain-containing protein [Gracilibacillus alcaliphilus]|uniref:VWA domain-containing protein n=1 Tax=Gracilibacillus alcaliphilus TaxID=1401441 RepID=UPI00195DC8FC|nr:VWA domain-containing protein [Gracilibacillus alcaliphilus]MBM7678782.1 magnesium chelatase subunit D [Gracilibacillus alcaliphilus]
MNRLIGQMKAKRGIAAAMIHPYLDRICIAGAIGTGKTTLLEAAAQYFSKEETVILPAHVTTEKLLGEKDITLLLQDEKKNVTDSPLYQAKVVVTDQFALMPASNQHMLVQLLKNKDIPHDNNVGSIASPRTAKWFYCLNQNIQDKQLFQYAKLCVQLLPIFEEAERREAIQSSADKKYELRKEEIEEAKQRLPAVQVSKAMLRLAVEVVLGSGCNNQEADIDLVETARALAALDADESVQQWHVEEAAGYVLAHRMGELSEASVTEEIEQQSEQEYTASESQNNKEHSAEEGAVNNDKPENITTGESIEKEASQNEQKETGGKEEETEQIVAALKVQSELLFTKRNDRLSGFQGKHQENNQLGGNGRMIRAVMKPTETLSLHHTLSAAAPYMKIREPRKGMAWAIEKEDMRFKLKEKQQGFTILFLVDASRSIAAKKQMQVVKGAVMELLRQAYQKRDRVGLVSFRKTEVIEELPFTNKFAEAKSKLRDIPTGGKTPLAAGLKKALTLCEKERRSHHQAVPYLVLLTDGNANETLKPGGTAAQARSEAYHMARKIAAASFPVSVIDTQSGRNRFGLAEELAAVLDGEYISLDVLTDQAIARTIQNKLHPLANYK